MKKEKKWELGSYKISYCEFLALQRRRLRIGQKTLAKKLKISTAMLSHLELGKREAKISFIEKWAKLLKLKLEIKILSK